MNGIRCPQCSLINPTSAVECQQCRFPFSHLPPTAYVSVPATDYEKTVNLGDPPPLFSSFYQIPFDNETGQRVYLWYRIYCGAFVVVAFATICLGFYMFVAPPGTFQTKDPAGQAAGGIIYILLGLFAATLYGFAFFAPRKPWNWVFGIVLLAFGIISCCFLPSLILLIFWVKPETRAFFGRT